MEQNKPLHRQTNNWIDNNNKSYYNIISSYKKKIKKIGLQLFASVRNVISDNIYFIFKYLFDYHSA